MIKRLQNIICMIVLIAVLIPCVAGAQDGAQTSSNQTFSNEELAQMLAPIALYPDVLLSQVLMAATYPFEVIESERWLTKNPYVKGDALDEALQEKDWDVSVLALCHYPKVLTMMSENISWAARLGDAFTNQGEDVMDTVQELRTRAHAAGNLTTTEEQKVIVEERIIRIEPVSTDYIYVPAYNPYIIYGPWWYPLFQPLPIILPGLVVVGPGIIFSPRFYVGFGVFGWSSFNWRERNVVIVNIDRTRKFNRHYYDYRGYDHRWRPDRDRRYVRERRGGEIPRFRPPVKPLLNGNRWDRKPGGDIPEPGKRRMPPDKPRVPSVTDREKRPIPRLDDKDRKPAGGTPFIINREKQPRLGQPETDPGKHPGSGVPRITDSDRVKQPERRLMEQGKPVQVRERDMKSDQRFTPREEKQDVPQRSIDRGDRPQRDGINREGRK